MTGGDSLTGPHTLPLDERGKRPDQAGDLHEDREELSAWLEDKQDAAPTSDISTLMRRACPPRYTPYPNPALADAIDCARASAPVVGPYIGHLRRDEKHPVYSFHPYHTKVPPAVIAELIRHYTQPGAVVLDPFCGTGMTGVAARDTGRDAILVDLSPAATFIAGVNTAAHNWTTALAELASALYESETKWGWLYKTEEGLSANYFVWSDIFNCPSCGTSFPFFPHGVIHTGTKVETRDSFPCPSCHADLNVRRVQRQIEDGHKVKQLVWVNAGSGRDRLNRAPTASEIATAQQAESMVPEAWYPDAPIDPRGYSARLAQLGDKGISDVSRMLSRRNLIIYSDVWSRLEKVDDPCLRNLCLATLSSTLTVVSERQGYFGGGGGMSGNLYMPIVRMEKNVYDVIRRKLPRMVEAEKRKQVQRGEVTVSTQSATRLDLLPNSSVDYIYTDPPFGANIIYSEVNLAHESWLGMRTNASQEAVIDETRGMDGNDYAHLMEEAFKECHRILKPGCWITVEFHNTNADIWNAIQQSLLGAGFLVAAVSTLDKGNATILGDIRPNSAKHDLLISAYKTPEDATRILASAAPQLGSLGNVIDQLLQEVPRSRPDEIKHHVFSRLVAYHLERGLRVGFSTRDLYDLIADRLGTDLASTTMGQPGSLHEDQLF